MFLFWKKSIFSLSIIWKIGIIACTEHQKLVRSDVSLSYVPETYEETKS